MKSIEIKVADEDQPKVLKVLADSGIILHELAIKTPRVRASRAKKAAPPA